VVKRVTVDATYIYTDKLYANISPANFSSETNKGSLQLPAFGLVDAGFSYKMLVGKDKSNSVNFRLNVNNLFDKTYIAESSSNNHAKTREDFASDALYQTYADTKLYNGVDTSNTVFFGFGRTWNFGINYNF
jgi:outer membrane receptor protein involved in Fe transport